MSIVVVGSIAFDTVNTPFGKRDRALGGSANYFSLAAHFFAPVRMVGVIGEDFPQSHLDLLVKRGIDTSGVERASGRSFHWHGEYGFDLSDAKTIRTELNAFEHFMPDVPENYRDASTVFLANIDPDLQIHVLKQMSGPKIMALDSMNFWINNKPKSLMKAISMVDILFINDSEIRALSGEHNVIKAARAVGEMGVSMVVVKRGEYGAMLSKDGQINYMPAFPLEEVFDPTGAGDAFAGGFLGYLDGRKNLDLLDLKQAMLMGTVMSSFAIEQFSFDRLLTLDEKTIEKRKNMLLNVTHFS